MTPSQYRAALAALGLTQAAAAAFLGVSLRTSQKYANGAPIPKGTAMLLWLMMRDQLTPTMVEAKASVESRKPRKRASGK